MSDNKQNIKNYTAEEVEKLVKATLSTSTEAFLEWLKNETDIVDITTREVLNNAEITVKDGHKLIAEYIYPKLRIHGIDFVK